ncbi:MAG: hypothetical protein ACRCZW_11770 [Lactobacillaceae bacterium]
MKFKKAVIAGLTTLALSPVASTLGNSILTTQVVHADTITNVKQSNNDDQVVSISNREIFDTLEAKGYDVKSILGKEDYQAALMQDMMRRGGTYIKTNKHGFTVYVNSAIVKLAVYGGSAAVATAIGAALTAAGHPYLAGTVAATITSIANSAGSKACDRGIYVRFSNKGSAISWGYQ